jgi:hypothetical protein
VVTGDLNAEPDADEIRLLGGYKTAPVVPGLVLVDAWSYVDPMTPGWTWDRRRPSWSVSVATRCWWSTRSATSSSNPRPPTSSSNSSPHSIVTSNKPFGRWGEVFGDDIVAAAMIDRLVHHADVVALKGDSYRLKDRDLGRVPAATTEEP